MTTEQPTVDDVSAALEELGAIVPGFVDEMERLRAELRELKGEHADLLNSAREHALERAELRAECERLQVECDALHGIIGDALPYVLDHLGAQWAAFRGYEAHSDVNDLQHLIKRMVEVAAKGDTE